MALSVRGQATGWKSWKSLFVSRQGQKISSSRKLADQPLGPPSLLTMRTAVLFQWLKGSGRECDFYFPPILEMKHPGNNSPTFTPLTYTSSWHRD